MDYYIKGIYELIFLFIRGRQHFEDERVGIELHCGFNAVLLAVCCLFQHMKHIHSDMISIEVCNRLTDLTRCNFRFNASPKQSWPLLHS